MSLYNVAFGFNPASPILIKMLDLKIAPLGGTYEVGRFRDVFISKDGKRLILYNRNGGPNRDFSEDVFAGLRKHPLYIKDYDCDFDVTFAYVEFSVPEEQQSLIDDLVRLPKTTETPVEKWKAFHKDEEAMMRVAEQHFKPLLDDLKKGKVKNTMILDSDHPIIKEIKD